ncbi:MAG: beta-lactamase family protein [Oscillospiraceae bacterium]|nr:beta-lactamase family protein [Oscillospiraceae bacterium]
MANFTDLLTVLLDEHMEEFGLPGYDCAVWRDGKEIYRRMVGVADLATGAPITESTLYNIYSNTKVITCVAALQLYEQGAFRLDDPLSLYFPVFTHMQVRTADGGLTDAKNPITIRDLFRMSAGIGDGDDYKEMGMRFYMETGGACPSAKLPEYLAACPLLFEPGTQFRYGICHEMLAALIEKLSGQSFGEYLKEHIFQPLDMKDTAFSLDALENKSLANQYRYNGAAQPLTECGAANCLIPPILRESASGGLISSVNDYMRFQQALVCGEQLLRRETIDLMRVDQLHGTMRDGYGYTHLGMGYGLGVRTALGSAAGDAPASFGPFGWGGATGSYGAIDPENRLCVFYMQHVFGADDVRMIERFRDVIFANL